MSLSIRILALALVAMTWSCGKSDKSPSSEGNPPSADALPNTGGDDLTFCICTFTTPTATLNRSIAAAADESCEAASILKSSAEIGADGQATGKYLITDDGETFVAADAACVK